MRTTAAPGRSFAKPPISRGRSAAAAALLAVSGFINAHADQTTDVVAAVQAEASPEQQLQSAVQAMRDGRDTDALKQLSGLVQSEPNFRLAQLLYARLLALHSGKPQVLLSPTEAQAPRLHELIDEYHARVDQLAQAPAPGSLPSNILKLAGDNRYVLLADLPNSRLYLLGNEGGVLHVVGDYYATLARNGYGKHSSGDLRTPVGIYRVTHFRPASELPAFYGAGAFVLNYPNAWDRAQGRSGYGIWLHGVPAGLYSRPPHASEGCLVLANDDLAALKGFVEIGDTPVIFSDRVDWLQATVLAAWRMEFEQRIEAWRTARATLAADAYLAFYDDAYLADHGTGKPLEMTISDLDLFSYPGEDGLVLARFTEDDQNGAYANLLRETTQYWQRDTNGEWKIVREENGPLPRKILLPQHFRQSPKLRTAGSDHDPG